MSSKSPRTLRNGLPRANTHSWRPPTGSASDPDVVLASLPMGTAVIGALLGLAVITGAISFHLFTPLGVDPNNDGGGLFVAACCVWASMAAMLVLRRRTAFELVHKLLAALQMHVDA